MFVCLSGPGKILIKITVVFLINMHTTQRQSKISKLSLSPVILERTAVCVALNTIIHLNDVLLDLKNTMTNFISTKHAMKTLSERCKSLNSDAPQCWPKHHQNHRHVLPITVYRLVYICNVHKRSAFLITIATTNLISQNGIGSVKVKAAEGSFWSRYYQTWLKTFVLLKNKKYRLQ